MAGTMEYTEDNFSIDQIFANNDNKYIQTSPFFYYCIHLATAMWLSNLLWFLFFINAYILRFAAFIST